MERRQRCALAEIAHEALEDLAAEIEEAGATVHLPDSRVAAEIDRRLMVRALQNLLDNAVKYADGRPPETYVAVERNGQECPSP